VAILITYSTTPKMLVFMGEQAAGEHIIGFGATEQARVPA
jgi:hypothetical protein